MHFANKAILIVGATGGLGAAIARAFAAEGASLALSGRSRLPDVDIAGGATVSRHQADLTDADSLAALRDEVLAAHGRIDVVINAGGCDLRKPLRSHTTDEFRRTLDVNLLGAMLLTQIFLPVLGEGMIMHVGGFADGRLAFPYYSADAASRAGLRTFCEAVNRELALTGQHSIVGFFSPSPVDTEAERPFLPLWQAMGVAIVSPTTVAYEMVRAVARRETVHMMGGLTTKIFAALNSIAPRLADALVMQRYGAKIQQFFSETSIVPQRGQATGTMRALGIVLITLSFVAYGVLLSMPLLPLEGHHKLALAPVLVVGSEIIFWIGTAIVGKELVTRYRRLLNPCHWISRT